MRSCNGLLVRHCDMPPTDVVAARDLQATTKLRTFRDLCFKKSSVDALAALDEGLYRRLTTRVILLDYATNSTGLPGAARLRRLTQLAEPAESPMESRLRWTFIEAGLPRPIVQAELHDPNGEFIARVDMYYPDARLVIEFDGRNHQDRLVADARRQNLLVNAGFKVLRFTSADLFGRPGAVVDQVREALASAGVHARYEGKPRNNAA